MILRIPVSTQRVKCRFQPLLKDGTARVTFDFPAESGYLNNILAAMSKAFTECAEDSELKKPSDGPILIHVTHTVTISPKE